MVNFGHKPQSGKDFMIKAFAKLLDLVLMFGVLFTYQSAENSSLVVAEPTKWT